MKQFVFIALGIIFLTIFTMATMATDSCAAVPMEYSCISPTANTDGSEIKDLATLRFCCGAQCVDIPAPSPTGGDVISYIDLDNSFAPLGGKTECTWVAIDTVGLISDPLSYTANLFGPGPPTKAQGKRVR
jgi:hypothetical protein